MSKPPKTEPVADEIIRRSKMLRLASFEDYRAIVDTNAPLETNLLALLDAETTRRSMAKVKAAVKAAGITDHKTMDTFEINAELYPHVNLEELKNLQTCEFIRKQEDVIALAGTGRGKTHLSKAIAYEAIKQGYKVIFRRANQLIIEMAEAKSNKELGKYTAKIKKADLLVLDELGYLTYQKGEAQNLFTVIGERHESGSTFITTNYEFSRWNEFIDDKLLVMAIVDRLVHHSIILNMNNSKSHRIKNSRSKVDRQ
jgi:DNA replication protein DnaC